MHLLLCMCPCCADANEVEIVRCNGLDPIVAGTMVAAEGLELGDGKSDKELSLLEELGTQCARALRNLSVNRKQPYNLCPFSSYLLWLLSSLSYIFMLRCAVLGCQCRVLRTLCQYSPAIAAFDYSMHLSICSNVTLNNYLSASNKTAITSLGAVRYLLTLMNYPNERIAQQVYTLIVFTIYMLYILYIFGIQ